MAKYSIIHKAILGCDISVLVSHEIGLKGIDFIKQRMEMRNKGAFLLNPWQYFSMRRHSLLKNLELRGAVYVPQKKAA
ncbi:MAG: hypothetical protein Q7S74_04975 [Nanoarchaeota archaeon]|nr:hypothetical protein [Nanoarchaeota archaeon]